MITFQEENLDDVRGKLDTLHQEHWVERSEVTDSVGLETNMKLFEILEAAGSLHIVTAKDGEKRIGYFVSVISPHPYCTKIIMGETNAIFLTKEYRKGFTGYKLIKKGIEFLRKRADMISISLPPEEKFISIATKLGLKLTNYIFMDINK